MELLMNNIISIVISNDHYNGLGVVRSLGESDIPVYLLLFSNNKHSFIDKSRYVTKTFRIAEDEEQILKTILDITDDQYRYIIFPLSDFSARAVDRIHASLRNNTIVPNIKGNMEQFLNKQYMKELVSGYGLPVPKGRIIRNTDDYSDWNVYPAIIKPLISLEGAKLDITIAETSSALSKSIKTFWEKGYSEVLVEEYITGTDAHMIEIMGCASEDNVYIAGIIRKIREYPIHNGSTSFAQIVDSHHGVDVSVIKTLLKDLGFIGLFDIEMKYCGDKAYFIECNFRNGAPGYALTLKNRNIPLKWINMTLKTNIKSKSSCTDKDYFMCEQRDFINMLKGTPGLFRWITDFRNSQKIFFSKKDIVPVVYYYNYRLLSRIIRVFPVAKSSAD